jgi:tetratricopeptide (TPR) repeat protein
VSATVKLHEKPHFRALGLLIAIAGILLLSCESLYSVKVAVADSAAKTSTEEGFRRASRLLPSNSFYHLEVSAYETAPNTDAEILRELERALILNPRETVAWIHLGLRAEAAGDYVKAENSFLKAARIDRQFGPRWRLANYYFRRQEPKKFWRWAYASAEMADGDLTPLFELCWRVTDDATAILTRAIPDNPNIQRQYLGFLLRENRTNAAEAVAERLLASPSQEDTKTLLDYDDRLLADSAASARNLSTALKIWNSLADHGLIPYQALRPQQAVSMTNRDFLFSPTSQGFDWRLLELPGIYTLWDKSHCELVVTFSGKEPENCEILHQFLPLPPAHSYRIKFSYRTRNVAANSGLVCHISGAASAAPADLDSVELSSEEWKQEAISFSTSPTTGLVRLVLGYQRPLGVVRIGLLGEGSISLRHFILEQVQ